MWALLHDLSGEGIQPSDHSVDLSSAHQQRTMRFGQARRPLPILGGQGMLHGLGDQPLLLEPGTGALVQCGNRGRAHAAHQPFAQYLAKQMVVTIPLPRVVQRNDK